MLKILILICIFISNNYAIDKHNYLLEYYKAHETYNKDTNKQSKDFITTFKESLTKYKEDVSKYWKSVLITSKYSYVVYSNNFKQRSIINYKKSSITIQVIATDIKIAQNLISTRYNNLFELTNQEAFRNELILRNTYKKLNIIFDTPLNNELLISNLLSTKYKEKVLQEAVLEEYKEKIYKNNKYYTSSYKLPSDFKYKLEKRYLKTIQQYEKLYNLPKNILYSMIKIKTSFNPYALNSDARFGLLLISNQIGTDAYYELYKDKRLLDAAYLYKFKNNIKIGATYFSILFNDKFKNITNNTTKMYFSILAYEHGLKNTLELFDNNIENINKLSAPLVYRKILKKLKNRNLRIYFSKVINTQKNTKLML